MQEFVTESTMLVNSTGVPIATPARAALYDIELCLPSNQETSSTSREEDFGSIQLKQKCFFGAHVLAASVRTPVIKQFS